jgi:L-rhamnose mutarotase
MRRVRFLLKVKEDRIREYQEHHKAVWPEMLDTLRRTGWHNYSLFMRDDGLLFGYFETPESFQAALDGIAKEEINVRWQVSWPNIHIRSNTYGSGAIILPGYWS